MQWVRWRSQYWQIRFARKQIPLDQWKGIYANCNQLCNRTKTLLNSNQHLTHFWSAKTIPLFCRVDSIISHCQLSHFTSCFSVLLYLRRTRSWVILLQRSFRFIGLLQWIHSQWSLIELVRALLRKIRSSGSLHYFWGNNTRIKPKVMFMLRLH